MNKPGMSTHQSTKMKNDEWLTPREILAPLGHFDLDPCSPHPDKRPWATADKHYHELGLMREWHGRVWLNPPYGTESIHWLKRLADHNNGIALIFAKTETVNFFSQIWDRADAILFIKGRLTFCYVDGTPAANNGGAPSCLVAYGENNVKTLAECNIPGKYIRL